MRMICTLVCIVKAESGTYQQRRTDIEGRFGCSRMPRISLVSYGSFHYPFMSVEERLISQMMVVSIRLEAEDDPEPWVPWSLGSVVLQRSSLDSCQYQ